MKLLKRFSVALCCMLAVFSFAACAKSEKELVLSASKEIAGRGEEVTLSAVLKDGKGYTYTAHGVEYEIVEGGAFGSLEENVLTISSSANPGSKIKISASTEDKTSNVVEIVVSVPLVTITASANGVTNIEAGSFVQLSKTLSPNPSDKTVSDVEWVITQGQSLCAITGDLLLVNSNASTGEKIKVKAVCGTIESDELVFTVGYPLESLEVEINGSTNIERDSSVELDVIPFPSNATNVNVTWEFVENGDLCTISSKGVLKINSDADVGEVIRFKAKSGTIESDEVTVVVGKPISDLVISYDDEVVTDPTKLTETYVPLTVIPDPVDASVVAIDWEVVVEIDGKAVDKSSVYASVSNNILMVKSFPTTPVGTVINVQAKSGNVESNVLEFTYGVHVNSVTASHSGSSNSIVKGNQVTLSATVSPNNATDKNIVWSIVEGAEVEGVKQAKLDGNTLTVLASAKTNETIKVKATIDGVDSNILEFTVAPTQYEINAGIYEFDINTDRLTLDDKADSVPVLSVKVRNRNYELVENLTITYTVLEGGENLVRATGDGYTCSFEILGHGEATLRVQIAGTETYEDIALNVVVPPESIKLPGVFAERVGYAYNFSMENPKTAAAYALPFVAEAVGDGVCEDLVYSFAHSDGSTGDDVAIYYGNEITFKKTGLVTVTVKSDSGSKNETSVSYQFNINEGYNVYTFEELQKLAQSSAYNGQQINIVVLEKPDSPYDYGYDLVSVAGLLPVEEQTLDLVLHGVDNGRHNAQRINFVSKSVHINGNKHKIDLSNVRPITKAEYAVIDPENEIGWRNFSGIIYMSAWNSSNTDVVGTHEAKIYDLEIVGNSGVDFGRIPENEQNQGDTFDPSCLVGNNAFGVINNGITIGDRNYPSTHYYIDINNVTVSGCNNGMNLHKIVGNGLVQNVHVYDCFANGIATAAAVVRLKNITFGSCGAAAIELTPPDSYEAGLGSNEKQTVSLEGYIDVSENLNNGSTVYFENYKFGGATIPQILTGHLQAYGQMGVAQSHFVNESGEFAFICFILKDFSSLETNHSVANYPAFQKGGIINAAQLPTDGSVDKEHQYIELNVDLSSYGISDAGKVLLYNHNYDPNYEPPVEEA